MQSVLAKVTAADVQTDPFPHVVIPDALDPDLYRRLDEAYPSNEVIAWAGTLPSNQRYPLYGERVLADERVAPVWKEFVAFHSSTAFFHQVVDLFRGYWEPDLLDALDGDLTVHPTGLIRREDYAKARILQDARPEINSPVTTRPSSSRGPHLDTFNRLFTCLLYLRRPDDDAVGGDLDLHRFRNGPPDNIDVFQFPNETVEVVKTVPYRANTVVIFRNGIDAIHGVSVRQPTPHTRRYVFISAEIERDWLRHPRGRA